MKNIKLYELEETYHNEESSLEYPTVSYTKDTEKVWYTPKPNQFIATYNVTSTTSPIYILGQNFMTSQVKEMYIDNVKQEQVFITYTFNTIGEHTVKCIMDDDFRHCYALFRDCSELTSLDLSNFDTSNVTDMTQMFHDCSGLTSLDLSNFDTSNVTNMYGMFSGCDGLTSLDLSNFDTSNVRDMENMFFSCTDLTSLDLSNFNTSNVTNMNEMFDHCSSLTSVTFGDNFDTSNVTDMSGMFSYCRSLTSLDLSNFDTSKVTTMEYMFEDCRRLTSIRFGSQADVSKVSSYGWMFYYNITTTGTLYYPSAYADSWNNLLVTQQSTTKFPSTWTAVAIDYENGETVPTV